MRLHLKISKSKQLVPFDHQHLLVGVIHKWLGINKEHGKLSLYSFSRLKGGKANTDGLLFDRGSSFFFSSYDKDLTKKLLNGIVDDAQLFYGLKVEEVVMQETPNFEQQSYFYIGSPVLIKRKEENRAKFYFYNDKESEGFLKESLLYKMKEAGLDPDESLQIKFDHDYDQASTKMINYNGIKNRCSWCHVIIEGKAETKAFAWHVGLGSSTGIGFGALM